MSRRRLRATDGLAALALGGIVFFVIDGPLNDNPPPTREQYVVKADKVCSDIEARQARLDNEIFKDIPFDRSPPDHLYVVYVKALIPTYEEQLEKLRKIRPPVGEEVKLENYFNATERALDLLKEIAADPKKVELLSTTNVFAEADAAGKEFGFLSCAHAED